MTLLVVILWLELTLVGLYEFVKKGDAPVMGITKLDNLTAEEVKRPRRKPKLETPVVPETGAPVPA